MFIEQLQGACAIRSQLPEPTTVPIKVALRAATILIFDPVSNTGYKFAPPDDSPLAHVLLVISTTYSKIPAGLWEPDTLPLLIRPEVVYRFTPKVYIPGFMQWTKDEFSFSCISSKLWASEDPIKNSAEIMVMFTDRQFDLISLPQDVLELNPRSENLYLIEPSPKGQLTGIMVLLALVDKI